MAGPPKGATVAAGYKGLGPFKQDADFQAHDHVSVDRRANIHVLDAISIRRRRRLRWRTYIGSIEH
jgi:hypothetical protein